MGWNHGACARSLANFRGGGGGGETDRQTEGKEKETGTVTFVQQAEARDATYLTDLDEIMKRHIDTAADLLRDDPEALSAFKSTVSNDVANLKAMLRAIYIGIVIVTLKSR